MVQSQFLILMAVITLSLCSVLITESVRLSLLFLGLLYMVSFFLLQQSWPLGLASVHLLSGLISVLIINSFCSKIEIRSTPPRIALDIFLVVFTGVITFAFASKLTVYINESTENLNLGLFLFFCGLLQAGTAQEPFRILISLLIISIGFQIIYAPLEGSALVTALLSTIQIVIALIGASMVLHNKEENQ